MLFQREELWRIREDALKEANVQGLNLQWKRAFEKLADAADYVDAMIARTEDKSITEIEDIK